MKENIQNIARRLLVRSCGQLLVWTETRLEVEGLVWTVFADSASSLSGTLSSSGRMVAEGDERPSES